MIGPDFKQPPTSVANNWLEADDRGVNTDHQEYRQWWSAPNDPVLAHLVELAYQQNLTLRAAGSRVLAARAQLGVAIGERYPQHQQVSAAVSYNRIPITVPGSS